ncbi:MAG: radical SAM protein [Methanomicrobiales archaeon]
MSAPRIISWDITLECPLTCSQGYADANEKEVEGVLSKQESFYVITQFRATGTPVVVLSGGETCSARTYMQPHGKEQELRMVMGNSWYFIDHDAAVKLMNAGSSAVAISLDAKDAATHDMFRGIDGVWEKVVKAVGYRRNAGIAVQINMSVMLPVISEVNYVIAFGTSLGVRAYQLFFSIPTGRAQEIDPRRDARR